ncbi:MAG: hypothetical protein ACKO0Z_24855 [Betaproteobacteria bacterium]
MKKAKASQISGGGRLQLTRALKQLREIAAELGDYSASRPTIALADGSHLTLTLTRAVGGGELLGCWTIRREWPDGRNVSYEV